MYQEISAPRGITDVIMVTDAKCRIGADLRERFNAWKQAAQVRVITLVINSKPGDLTHVSDEVHCVDSLDPSDDAVGRVLSL